MNAKERGAEIYQQHLALATTDGRLFRKTVMDQLMTETGCSLAAAATHYNNAKKAHEASNGAIQGLGRAPVAKGVRKPTSKGKDKVEVPDNECFTVLELIKDSDTGFQVGRCQSFVMQGDASEKFDDKVVAWPACSWVMIQGLGPNSGETYRLGDGEKEIKRYQYKKEQVTE